jgi:AraC-like DNA-binding protein
MHHHDVHFFLPAKGQWVLDVFRRNGEWAVFRTHAVASNPGRARATSWRYSHLVCRSDRDRVPPLADHTPYPNDAARPVGAPALMRRALGYLLTHHDQQYVLEDLTSAAGTDNPFYLLQTFKQELGLSPGEFVRRILVAKTCLALAASPLKPLEALAVEVGWPGKKKGSHKSNVMIKHFKKVIGVTPNAFRLDLQLHPIGYSFSRIPPCDASGEGARGPAPEEDLHSVGGWDE